MNHYQIEDNKFIALKRNWFLTPIGITASIICIGAINMMWAFTTVIVKYVEYSNPKMGIGSFILISIIPIFVWLLLIIKFFEHKNDYVCFHANQIIFSFKGKEREVKIDHIRGIVRTNEYFRILLYNEKDIKVNKDVIGNLQGANELRKRLMNLNAPLTKL